MSSGTGHLWASLVIGLTVMVAGGLGILIGIPFGEPVGLGIASAIAGVGILYGAALYRGSVRNNEFAVVERLGKYWDVKFAGLRLAFPFIDRVRENYNFFGFDVELFLDATDPKGEKRVRMNFRDGASAPVDTSAWLQIGNPGATRDELREDVLKWTYTVLKEEREERLIEICASALRPELEKLSLEEVEVGTTAGSTVADAVRLAIQNVEIDLFALGVHFTPGKGIVIRGLELPSEIVAIRELVLTGQKRALEMEAASSGYWSSIQEIINAAAKANPPINLSADKAQEIFERQIALGVIKEAKANITFIASDIDAVTRAIIAGVKGAEKP